MRRCPALSGWTGSLDFPDETLEAVRAVAAVAPTVIDVYLDRPANLTPLVEMATAILVNFGIAEDALCQILFADDEPQGRLLFDLPSSATAVAASRIDVPYDTADPLFRFGHGLRYGA